MRQPLTRRQRRARFFFIVLLPIAVILLLSMGFPVPESATPTMPTHTPAARSVSETPAAQPTRPAPKITAQPAPLDAPPIPPLTITQEPAEALAGDVPGILGKPLENPTAWAETIDLMMGFPVMAWKCDNASLTPLANVTPEVQALVETLNESRAAFDEAVSDLEAEGYTVRTSKPLVFTGAFSDLPIGQTTDCKVLQALDLFEEAPENLPTEIGLVAAERTGTVDGEPAFERIWIVAWK